MQFLKLAASGKVDEAYEKYVDMSGKHHNVYFQAGFPALKAAMKESHEKEPNKTFTPKYVLCDGDLIAVYSQLIRKADSPEIAVVHMFPISSGKIIEMWDTGWRCRLTAPMWTGLFNQESYAKTRDCRRYHSYSVRRYTQSSHC